MATSRPAEPSARLSVRATPAARARRSQGDFIFTAFVQPTTLPRRRSGLHPIYSASRRRSLAGAYEVAIVFKDLDSFKGYMGSDFREKTAVPQWEKMLALSAEPDKA